MRILLKESQLIKLLEKHSNEIKKDITLKKEEQDVTEQETGASQASTTQGYPEVGKWESGVTRGPANQIGLTKWSDVVGSVLKRSKANQLK
jgi:hypothetical protein